MSVTDLFPGEWYLMITCYSCNTRQALLHDLTKGKSRLKVIYSFTCPHCGEKADYDSDQIERYEHREDNAGSNSV